MFLPGGNCLVLPLAEGRIFSTVLSEESIMNPEKFSVELKAAQGPLIKSIWNAGNWEKENQSLRLNQELDQLLEYI